MSVVTVIFVDGKLEATIQTTQLDSGDVSYLCLWRDPGNQCQLTMGGVDDGDTAQCDKRLSVENNHFHLFKHSVATECCWLSES